VSKESGNVTAFPTADDFLAAASRVVMEEVYVPATNHTIHVKSLNAADVQYARSAIVTRKNGVQVPREDRDFAAMIAFLAACNPDGTRFFRDDQIDALNTKANYGAIQPISKVALRLSGLDDEAEELARKKHFEGSGKDA
jgi:hypothetical protein